MCVRGCVCVLVLLPICSRVISGTIIDVFRTRSPTGDQHFVPNEANMSFLGSGNI